LSGFEDPRVRTFVDLLRNFEPVELQEFRHVELERLDTTLVERAYRQSRHLPNGLPPTLPPKSTGQQFATHARRFPHTGRPTAAHDG